MLAFGLTRRGGGSAPGSASVHKSFLCVFVAFFCGQFNCWIWAQKGCPLNTRKNAKGNRLEGFPQPQKFTDGFRKATDGKGYLWRQFQNLVGVEVTRLKHSEDQSLLTSSPTVLNTPRWSL